jgi:two-component system, response regulator YesN
MNDICGKKSEIIFIIIKIACGKRGGVMNSYIKKLIQNKGNLFVSWMASYAVILLVPIIIGSIAYFTSIKVINEEVNKAENASLRQLKTAIDGKFEEINKLSSIIVFNQRVTKLAYLDRTLDSSDLITINEIQSDLSKFKMANEFIDDIYIYFGNNKFFLSDKNKYEEWGYDFLSKDVFAVNTAELMKLVGEKHLRSYNIITKDDGTGKKVSRIIFLQTVYSNDLSSSKGTLIVSLNRDKILQQLQNLQWNPQGKAMIIDSGNNLIVNGKMDFTPELFIYSSLPKEESTFYKKMNGNNVAISNIKSGVTDWKYIYFIPSKVYLQKAQYVKNILYVYIGLCLLLGFIMSYVFAKKNYNPVKKMTQLFVSRLGSSSGQEHNEFNFLENSLKSLLDENDSNIARLNLQNEAMRNNLFIRMLKGRVRNVEDIRDSLDVYGIKLPKDRFVVMLFSIEQLSGNFLDEKALENEESISLISFIIRNVVEELSSEKHLGYMAEVDGMMACLVNLSLQKGEVENLEAVKADMLEIAEKSIEFIQDRFGIGLSVTISKEHSGITGIAKAYSEALEVVEYKYLMEDKNRITHFSAINSFEKSEIAYGYNLDKERQFINCIKAEDYEGAREIIDDIITSSMSNNFKSLQILKCRMFGLINAMLNTIWDIQTEVDVKFFEELNPVNKLLNTKSIVELKGQVKYILGQIGQYFKNKNKEQIPAWVTELESFIEKNYFDQHLSIGSISDKFGMNVSYISRAYKKYRGLGLLDHIHKVRLENAKKLMSTELNNKEIAQKVGYIDSGAMIRAFKRYEGTTPGKFRDSE